MLREVVNLLETVTETVFRRCSLKNVFLKISLNSQEKTYVGVSFLKGHSDTGVFL